MANQTRGKLESLAHAAERTDVSIKTLRRMISAGKLPAYRMGTRILRVDPEDVDRLLVKVPTGW